MNEECFKREVEAVKRLGDQIGYGNMMWIASALWAKSLIENELPDSGAFYPAILTNMKDSDLTDYSIADRTAYLELFKKWGL